MLAALFNHKGHVIHPTVINILRPYILLSVFPVIVMTLDDIERRWHHSFSTDLRGDSRITLAICHHLVSKMCERID